MKKRAAPPKRIVRDRIHVYLDPQTARRLQQYARACDRTASKAGAVLIREGLARPWPVVPVIDPNPPRLAEELDE